MPKTVLIAGGAGFVGSSIAIALREADTGVRIVAFDNLRRRGSELNLARLRNAGVDFVHGDIRVPEDLAAACDAECIVECGGEASVWAGYGDSPHQVLQSNLIGAINCLEYARVRKSAIIFMSTSRIYPLGSLRELKLTELDTRFNLAGEQASPGVSEHGIAEEFPLAGVRSLYGTTKLSAELLLQEYVSAYGIYGVINRCGLIAGPWQMGKIEQGVVTLWVARHVYGGSLAYMGYGGTGKQVRDVLHVADLARLVQRELEQPSSINGCAFNVGGGVANSVSLVELTQLCHEITGASLTIQRDSATRDADIPYYATDARRIESAIGWKAEIGVKQTISDIHEWILENRAALTPLFGP